ncbi:peptidase M22 [Alicyclobacillus sp. SO9]|nr:peptidase M22 [Alicyclobacillus sp. SO9]
MCAVRLSDGRVAADSRKLLPVPLGDKGLRQSDALFFHVQQMPEVFARLRQQLTAEDPDAEFALVSVSAHPRPLMRSYMPVFKAGVSFAETLALMANVPVYRTSHQEGHIAAAEYFLEEATSGNSHFAVHLSGGTTDVLLARRTEFGYNVSLLGEGLDLHAGQFVDRVGVAMGFAFPAGPMLERAANETVNSEFRLPSRVQECRISFSGPCSAALRALDTGTPQAEVALAVENCIANSVVKALLHASKLHPHTRFAVIAGGVAANAQIRHRIAHRLAVLVPSLRPLFAPPEFSRDNALGVATIGRRFMLGKHAAVGTVKR